LYAIRGLASSIYKCDVKPLYWMQTFVQMEIQNVLKKVSLALYLSSLFVVIRQPENTLFNVYGLIMFNLKHSKEPYYTP